MLETTRKEIRKFAEQHFAVICNDMKDNELNTLRRTRNFEKIAVSYGQSGTNGLLLFDLNTHTYYAVTKRCSAIYILF